MIKELLGTLEAEGNLRRLPTGADFEGRVDLSSNDYLGIAADGRMMEQFLAGHIGGYLSASASRLLASRQQAFEDLEETLAESYGRPALAFNSGYHANVGMLSALGALPGTVFVADKLVHASIIDGIRLGGWRLERFRHNDLEHAMRVATRVAADSSTRLVVLVAESVYSMDGDRADLAALADIKHKLSTAVETLLYIDEAHAVGVLGPGGLGLVSAMSRPDEVDIVVGTFGKALASVGAYGVMSDRMRDFFINRARSLIFSTALAPLNVMWSREVFTRALEMDTERAHLSHLGRILTRKLARAGADILAPGSHIQPWIVGSPVRAIEMSQGLDREGYKVLPIRRPTVPPGTERLRFSLGANITVEQLEHLNINGI